MSYTVFVIFLQVPVQPTSSAYNSAVPLPPSSSPPHNTSTSVDKPRPSAITQPLHYTTPNLPASGQHRPIFKTSFLSHGRNKQPLLKKSANNRSLGTQYNPVDLTTPTTIATPTNASVQSNHRYPFSSTPYPLSQQPNRNHDNDPKQPFSPLLPSISSGNSGTIMLLRLSISNFDQNQCTPLTEDSRLRGKVVTYASIFCHRSI